MDIPFVQLLPLLVESTKSESMHNGSIIVWSEKNYTEGMNRIYLEFCKSGWQKEWANILGMSRQALHGRHLRDMETGVCFSAPLPEDFLLFLRSQK